MRLKKEYGEIMVNSSIDTTAIGNRIRQIRRKTGLNQKDFSIAMGIGSGTLARYELGENTPSLDFISIAVEKFGIDILWLISGKYSQKQNTNDKDGELVYIPQLDLSFSAGHGIYPDDRVLIIGHRPFGTEWLRSKGLNPKNLALMRVHGDSMDPLLKDKDIVMIDQSVNSPLHTMPIAFRLDGELYIKMYQASGDGRLEMISKNKEYPTIYINMAKPPNDFSIIGAVVWHAHSWI